MTFCRLNKGRMVMQNIQQACRLNKGRMAMQNIQQACSQYDLQQIGWYMTAADA